MQSEIWCSGNLSLETSDTILLFEVKKKHLRRDSRSGHDLRIIEELAKGFIKGVYELTKQAILLREHGKLILPNEANAYCLEA